MQSENEGPAGSQCPSSLAAKRQRGKRLPLLAVAPAIESIRFLISLLLTPNQDARGRSPCWLGSESLPVPHQYHGACSHSVWLAKHRTAFDTHVLTGDLICLRQHPCSPVDEHLWNQTVPSTPPSLTLRRKEQQHVMNATNTSATNAPTERA